MLIPHAKDYHNQWLGRACSYWSINSIGLHIPLRHPRKIVLGGPYPSYVGHISVNIFPKTSGRRIIGLFRVKEKYLFKIFMHDIWRGIKYIFSLSLWRNNVRNAVMNGSIHRFLASIFFLEQSLTCHDTQKLFATSSCKFERRNSVGISYDDQGSCPTLF